MEIKDKPNSMSVREWIVKKLATTIIIPEKEIKQVIAHQFDTAYEALNNYDSIEISGFGKFYFNRKKAKNELQSNVKAKEALKKIINNSATTEKKRQSARRKLSTVERNIEALNKKGII